jgi:hypothetical protein
MYYYKRLKQDTGPVDLLTLTRSNSALLVHIFFCLKVPLVYVIVEVRHVVYIDLFHVLMQLCFTELE